VALNGKIKKKEQRWGAGHDSNPRIRLHKKWEANWDRERPKNMQKKGREEGITVGGCRSPNCLRYRERMGGVREAIRKLKETKEKQGGGN